MTAEEIDTVSIKAYGNANKNPKAHMKQPKWTPRPAAASFKFLNNEEYKPFVKVSDCSQVSDGASAMLLVLELGKTR